jgi:DnaA-homolog protein
VNQQLTLNISKDSPVCFNNFFWQSNPILKNTLMASLSFKPQSERIFYLWGEEGSGKSHLLQASCYYLGMEAYPCAYVPLKEMIYLSPEILDNLEQLSLVAIDDLELIAGNKTWEEALFHLYNKILTQEKTRLIMASSHAMANLAIQLPDLRSRLKAGINFHVASLDEAACISLLNEHATEKGLIFPEDVAQFLIRRFPRNPGKLLEIFHQLDQAVWKEQHRLTIPFVKKTLGL